jgi:hypothetical protein
MSADAQATRRLSSQDRQNNFQLQVLVQLQLRSYALSIRICACKAASSSLA